MPEQRLQKTREAYGSSSFARRMWINGGLVAVTASSTVGHLHATVDELIAQGWRCNTFGEWVKP
jgi:hypothetical protein